MQNNYTTSVNNFESLINYVEEKYPLFPEHALNELRACVFVLKIQPQYQGLKDVPKQETPGDPA